MSIDWSAERQATIDRHEDVVREMGLGAAWDHLLADDTATTSLLLSTLGSIATWMRDTGYVPPSATQRPVDLADEARALGHDATEHLSA